MCSSDLTKFEPMKPHPPVTIMFLGVNVSLSHDCHVIMTQLLPISLRGLLPENIRVPIVKLCAFLDAISQKVIGPESLPGLQTDVAQCLVSFELVFPPSFFNIMTHLLVHLVEEVAILGPIFLHNMFPFESYRES